MNHRFRQNHLVRLCGFGHIALDGKLGRVESNINTTAEKVRVEFLDGAHPPEAVVPARSMQVRPENVRHACEHCLVAEEGDTKLLICGRCKTAHYCNAECQHADWERHKTHICGSFAQYRCYSKPLHSACHEGDIVEVRRLVEVEGADIDRSYSGGPTPLTVAAMSGKIGVVRYLVEQGADMSHVPSSTNGPLTALCGAALTGEVEVVSYLAQQGADVNAYGALFVAACEGYVDVARSLVDHGADVDVEDGNGLTAVGVAAKYGHYAMVRYLVQQGADKNAANNVGVTPLQAARSKGHTQVAAYLLAEGAVDG